MKTIRWTKILAAVLFSLGVLNPISSRAQLLPPLNDYELASWSFDGTNWLSPGFHTSLMSDTNIANPPDWDGNALLVDSTNAAWLQFAIVNDSGQTNMTFNQGSIEFWFMPLWSSGEGPGDFGRLIDVGADFTNSPSSWFSLYFTPGGTNLCFSSETNGVFTNYLNYTIAWVTNQWHLIDLTYSDSATKLYLDGQLAATGPGEFYQPDTNTLANGFFVGSDSATGTQQMRGEMDNLATYNYALSGGMVANDYTNGWDLMNGITPPDDYTNTYTPPSYGTNIYLAQISVVSNAIVAVLSNSTADVEYLIQTNSSLATTNWGTYGFISGSEITNWTPLSVVSANPTNNLFIRLQSWSDSTGTEIPDFWWIENFGQDTNVDAYADPTGDGWTALQDFLNGWDPNAFETPPAPQGLQVQVDNSTLQANLSWQPDLGNVSGYTIYEDSTPIGTVSASQTTYSTVLGDPYSGTTYYGTDFIPPTFHVVANYTNGVTSVTSAPSATVNISPEAQQTVQIIPDAAGHWEVAAGPLPPDAAAVLLFNGNTGVSNSIPISDFTNGFYVLPDAFSATNPVLDCELLHSNGLYDWEYQDLLGSETGPQTPPAFYDGRRQLKDNLIFQLRAATAGPLQFEIPSSDSGGFGDYDGTYSYPTNYAYAGFYAFANPSINDGVGELYGVLDWFLPFEENCLFGDFVFNPTNADNTGNLTTGAGYDGYGDVVLNLPLTYEFSNPTPLPDLLETNASRWLFVDNPDANWIVDSGLVSYSTDWNTYWTWSMVGTGHNWFGLSYLSTELAWGNVSGDTTTLTAGNSATGSGDLAGDYANAYLYLESEQPQFQTVEYDFWNSSWNWTWQAAPPILPGNPNFSPTNASQLLVASVGSPFQFAGYVKLAVTNGYSGVYGYLQQYFTNAYEIDTNGDVTTNTTGILSPYGSFFPTQPGPVALVTMPDPDTEQQGTGTVHCISMNVDKNHDGTMDLSWNGPDATSQSSPMVFWINNDRDVPASGAFLSTPLDHDIDTPNIPDCSLGYITCRRGLEDFARFWLCGLPSLPADQGYTVTMSCSAISGSPAINLYTAEPGGGIGYLTNIDVAQALVNEPKLATVSPTSTYTFPDNFFDGTNKYLLFEGTNSGEGQFTLTIHQNGSVVGQASTYINLHDIKDLYEQAHIVNVQTTWPQMVNSPTTSSYQIDHQISAQNLGGTNQLVVFVHGWRMPQWGYYNFSETMLKRLYWQGYQGQFAALHWPTPSSDTYSNGMDYLTFNRSENIALESGAGVASYFDNLAERFTNYNISVCSHSQGADVVASALVQLAANDQTPIQNYVIMQGAFTAQSYDSSVTNDPNLVALESVVPTPNAYVNYASTIDDAVQGNVVNFFNREDFALSLWYANELFFSPTTNSGVVSYVTLKPDVIWGYQTDGTSAWLTNNLPDQLMTTTPRAVTNIDEMLPFVARARSLAVGQQAGVTNAVNGGEVNLETQFGFTDAYYDHSGEFNHQIQDEQGYLFYFELLRALQTGHP